MGLAAGGMLPVTYALLAEMVPSRQRGRSLVLVGGLGAVLGYFAASGFSAWLQPTFGWRILWLLNLPTGLCLILLGVFIPESAKFLLARGRREEARLVMERFGAKTHRTIAGDALSSERRPHPAAGKMVIAGKLVAFSIAATCFGFVYFGLMLWLPGDLVAKGYSVSLASKLLAESALIAVPTIFAVAYAYSAWSAKWSVVGSLAIMLAGLFGVARLELARDVNPVIPVALLVVSTNGLIAMLLPFAAESFPMRIRGRTTGTVAACSKGGGVVAQFFAIIALVPPLAIVSLVIMVPTVAALILVTIFGKETRGRDLRDLDPDGDVFAAAGL